MLHERQYFSCDYDAIHGMRNAVTIHLSVWLAVPHTWYFTCELFHNLPLSFHLLAQCIEWNMINLIG